MKTRINISLVMGMILSLVVFVLAMFESTTRVSMFLNLVAIAIVFGGMFSSALVMYPWAKLVGLTKRFFRFMKFSETNLGETAQKLVKFSQHFNQGKNLSDFTLTKAENPRLYEALELVDAGMKTDDLKHYIEKRQEASQDEIMGEVGFMLTMSKLGPAYGLLGTLVGLIVLLSEMATSGLDGIGPAMAISLTATLYGVLASNMIFVPIAEYMAYRADLLGRLDSLILHGVEMIKEKKHPLQLRELLKSHLNLQERDIMDQMLNESQFQRAQQVNEGQQVA